jgi:UDP-glucuronate 4-epimerase
MAGVMLAALDSSSVDDGQLKAGRNIRPHAVYNIGNNQSDHLMRFIELLEEPCDR